MKYRILLIFSQISLLLTLGSCNKEVLEKSGAIFNPGAGVAYNGYAYPTIVLGNGQEWMAENLKTTQYNDGTPIPLVTDTFQWYDNYINNTTLPMMCWYNNDQATYTANSYGALYNWYAVSPSNNGNHNVCPVGWHVPGDAEWTALTDYLGGEAVAGGKMKSKGMQYWLPSNQDATNESGFSGLPGGARWFDGYFIDIGYYGYWWTSTADYSDTAWWRNLLGFQSSSNLNGMVFRNATTKRMGFSVRCVRD